ncbi:hypothetical protein MKW92_013683 [Papaver armeniacum]|nr:hypothetical protein MKW92_013683 [Papaver armeniacum]
MRSPRLQELARLRELAENEKDEERKARNESLRLTPQLHVASKSPIEQVVNQKNSVVQFNLQILFITLVLELCVVRNRMFC